MQCAAVKVEICIGLEVLTCLISSNMKITVLPTGLAPPADEVVRIFEEHVAQCVARAAEARAAPGSEELRAMRPKFTAFKLYVMAVKSARWGCGASCNPEPCILQFCSALVLG